MMRRVLTSTLIAAALMAAPLAAQTSDIVIKQYDDGVFNLELARLYSYLFQKTKKNYSIIFSLDGYDEISLTGSTKIISRKEENIYLPEDLGFKTLTQKSINGGKTIEESAKIFMNILSNNGTSSQNNVVIANSGLAISTALGIPISEGIERAKESLISRKALESFNNLKKISGS